MTSSDTLLALKKSIHEEWVAKLKRHAIFKLVYDKMIAHENVGGPPPTSAEFEEWRIAVAESMLLQPLVNP